MMRLNFLNKVKQTKEKVIEVNLNLIFQKK
jgi:hypothetical protein